MAQDNLTYECLMTYIFTTFVVGFFYKFIDSDYYDDLIIILNEYKEKLNNSINNLLIYNTFIHFLVTVNKKYYYDDNTNNDTNNEDSDDNKVEPNNNADKHNAKNNKQNKNNEIKYENKYLDDIKKINKYFELNDEELEIKNTLFLDLYQTEMEKPEKQKEYINQRIEELRQYILKLFEDETESDDKNIDNLINIEDMPEEYNKDEWKIILIKDSESEIKKLTEQLEELNKIVLNESEIRANVNSSIDKRLIKKRLEKLKGCYIIEKTPLGNVIMTYNNDEEKFEYYSDNTIPYRYLETVGRKFVKTFNCRPIFIDMEEELKECEKKLKEQEENEKMVQEDNKDYINDMNGNKNTNNIKKNVFAKFKSYNKEGSAGKVNTAPPPKNSIPNRTVLNENGSVKMLLKDKANRYSHEGRFSNFNILQKISRKVVDKKFNMSFAEFKKNQLSLKNKN